MLRSLPINKVYDNVVDKIVSIHVSIRGVGTVPLKQEDEPDQKGRDC